jgi:hypothetical protein
MAPPGRTSVPKTIQVPSVNVPPVCYARLVLMVRVEFWPTFGVPVLLKAAAQTTSNKNFGEKRLR